MGLTGDILIVDGYNMIGAWPELREIALDSLEEARDRLIEQLADYQGYSGLKVVVVFDAHQVPGLGARLRQSRVDVRYTKEKETADECIERLVAQYEGRRHRVHVATSDFVEQSVVFGKGALRISARELLIQVEESKRMVRHKIEDHGQNVRHTFDHRIDEGIREILERWRRGQ